MMFFLLACSISPSEPSTASSQGQQKGQYEGKIAATPLVSPGPAPSPALVAPEPEGSEPPVVPASAGALPIEEGPWSIRNRKGGEVIGALLAFCKNIYSKRCVVAENSTEESFKWLEVPASNQGRFYWPNSTTGQQVWYVTVPVADVPRLEAIRWQQDFGFTEVPAVEMKGISAEVPELPSGYAAKEEHFRPVAPFKIPSPQWAWSGSYFGNEQNSCFKLESEVAGEPVATGWFSVSFPTNTPGVAENRIYLPENFKWAGKSSGAAMTITYSAAGVCQDPGSEFIKYRYLHRYK